MVKESYVSFETAKLLKERGFDVYGDGSIDSGIEIHKEYSPNGKLNDCSTSRPHNKAYPAPTQQMAMRWLREENRIFIEISVSIDLNGNYHYSYSILDKECKYIRKGLSFEWNYEDAVEAAIKACLENLI